MPAFLSGDLVYANRIGGQLSGSSSLGQLTAIYRVRTPPGEQVIPATASLSGGLVYANHLEASPINGEATLSGDLVFTTLRGAVSGQSGLTGNLVITNHLQADPISGSSRLVERVAFTPPYFYWRQLFREMSLVPQAIDGAGAVVPTLMVRVIDVSGGGYWMDLDGFTIISGSATRVRGVLAGAIDGEGSLAGDLTVDSSGAEDLEPDAIVGGSSLAGEVTRLRCVLGTLPGGSSLSGAIRVVSSLAGLLRGRATLTGSLVFISKAQLDPLPALTPGLDVPFKAPSFLGRGLQTPLRRAGGDFVNAEGEAHIRACVEQVLGTECSMPNSDAMGELPWRPEFGSALYRLRHRAGGAVTEALASQFVVDALRRWEPRISVTGVQFIWGRTDKRGVVGADTLVIRVKYDIIRANVPGNNVVISGITQDVRV